MRIALVPEPGVWRVYGLATLVNTFGFLHELDLRGECEACGEPVLDPPGIA